jgi:predicted DNA-binding transcriptional regulator
MKRSRIMGAIIFLGALEGIIAYGILVYFFPIPVLQLSMFVVVALILGMTAWIGYRLMMAPPPKPEEEEEKAEKGREAEQTPSAQS